MYITDISWNLLMINLNYLSVKWKYIPSCLTFAKSMKLVICILHQYLDISNLPSFSFSFLLLPSPAFSSHSFSFLFLSSPSFFFLLLLSPSFLPSFLLIPSPSFLLLLSPSLSFFILPSPSFSCLLFLLPSPSLENWFWEPSQSKVNCTSKIETLHAFNHNCYY